MSIIKNAMARSMVKKIKKAVESKKYVFFDGNLSWNLNIIGIRSDNNKVNHFDDNIVIIYRNSKKEWEVFSGAATTDPGLVPLLKPINKNGTAILVPGQYRGSHKIDLHAGKYVALRQSGAPVKVYRDDDHDKVLDMDIDTIQEGYFGINIHRGSRRGDTKLVQSYSAGCQVFKNARDFRKFMEICENSASKFGNKFTYTLLEEKDLESE